MGRPPGNGGPTFRFNSVEVGEMEAILQAHNYAVPAREILDALAQRFSSSAERAGQIEVSGKQVWNWFQNRRYALRARAARTTVPGQVNMPPVPQGDEATVRTVPPAPHAQPPQPQPAPSSNFKSTVRTVPQLPHPLPSPSVAKSTGRNTLENSPMEFEAKSARDGAWYDVASFLSHRSLETAEPEALVRFSGFGPEEDEWVNIRKHVRQRSLPCESSECVAILPGDLILCFQEGKEQALYFDAHVLDAQRRRHDVRGCRCRILVRYDHDHSEEIVPLRKICRRPETDYRMQQLHMESVNVNPQKNASKEDADSGTTQTQMTTATTPTNVSVHGESKLQPSNMKVNTAGEPMQMQVTTSVTTDNASTAGESKLQPYNLKVDAAGGTTQMQINNATVPTNVSVAGESKFQPCNLKVDPAVGTTQMQMITATVPTNIFSASESKLQTSNLKVDAAGGTSQMQMTSSTTPVSSESELQPCNLQVDAAGGTTEMQITNATMPANVSVSAQPSNLKVDDVGGTTEMQISSSTTPTNVPVASESKLEPSNMDVDGDGGTTETQMETAMATNNGEPQLQMWDAGDVMNTTDGSGSNPGVQQGETEV